METLVLVEPSTGPASSGGTVADHLLFSSSFVDRQSPNSSFNAFLDPMSLAEAIFFSDSSANGHESPPPSSTSKPRSSDYIFISVSDPQKEEELSNSFVPGGTTYYTDLLTRTNLHEYGGPRTRIRVQRQEAFQGRVYALGPAIGVVHGVLHTSAARQERGGRPGDG